MKNIIISSVVAIIIICTTGISYKASANSAPSTDTTIVIKVKNIECPDDCKDITMHVTKKDGIITCKQIGNPGATSTFEITFNPAKISYMDVITTVESTPGCENPNEQPYRVKRK